MMRSAYLYQTINLLVTILMVPLLLKFLDVSGFVLWSIFTTFGGITLQLENAIQSVSVREIARQYHSDKADALKAAVRKAKRSYTFLSLSVLLPICIIGLMYMKYVASEKLGYQGSIEWLIFVAAYALNYYFGINNSILLGMLRVSDYNNINTFTRIINFLCTYLLLKLGFSVMGISLSFALSVIIGVVLISRVARKTLKDFYIQVAPEVSGKLSVEADTSSTIKYTFCMLASFVLYKGGLLIATVIFPKELVGSYGLSLQASTLLSAFALVIPMQVWLHRLVSAVTSKNSQDVFRQLVVGIVAANAVFVTGAIFLALFGNTLLGLIDSQVLLVNSKSLVLMNLAFLVELNIFILVNYLVVVRNYTFVSIYIVTSLLGVALAVLVTWITRDNILTLVVVPLILQAIICLPAIFRIACYELKVTPKYFLANFIRNVSLP